MQNHILQLLQQHVFVVEESGCWIGLQSRYFTHREYLTYHSFLFLNLHQLETYIRQEWDQIPTPKLQKLITSMPRHLQTVLKRGDATPWWTFPLPNYFENCSRRRILNELILFITLSQFKHLLCSLCSIRDKILAHVIWNYFRFHFIQI